RFQPDLRPGGAGRRRPLRLARTPGHRRGSPALSPERADRQRHAEPAPRRRGLRALHRPGADGAAAVPGQPLRAGLDPRAEGRRAPAGAARAGVPRRAATGLRLPPGAFPARRRPPSLSAGADRGPRAGACAPGGAGQRRAQPASDRRPGLQPVPARRPGAGRGPAGKSRAAGQPGDAVALSGAPASGPGPDHRLFRPSHPPVRPECAAAQPGAPPGAARSGPAAAGQARLRPPGHGPGRAQHLNRLRGTDMHADIIIVGAGMVGGALALALKDSGLDILLVDGASVRARPFDSAAPFEPRVSALSAASQNLLERLGAWPGIRARRCSPYAHMQVWDGSGTGQIRFSAASVHAEVLGHIVENRVVQDALLECLQDGPVRLLGDARVERLERGAGGWRLILADGRELQAPLLVAADGANSAVRRLAGCETREWDYFHHAIVTSVRCAEEHGLTAWQRFTDDGPLAFLPLDRDGDRHWCSIVWSCIPDEAERLMALDEPAFRTELGKAFEHRLGEVLEVDPRVCIPLRQRHAKRYIAPGLALIGDAAHVIHPLAGQGVNLGFLDAGVLA